MLTHDILFKRSPLDFILLYMQISESLISNPEAIYHYSAVKWLFVWDPYTGGIPYYWDVSYCNL